MTKPHLIDLLPMREIPTLVNRISGYLKKRCGTWNATGGKGIKQFILRLRLWMWSALHHPDFKHFEISYTKIIQISMYFLPKRQHFFEMHIELSKPQFYMFEPWSCTLEFLEAHGLPPDAIEDNVPF